MKMVDDLKKGHLEILQAIDGLSADDLKKGDTIGKWSARDVLLHLAMWDGEALKALSVWRTGHDYDWAYAEDYLKFNEFWVATLKDLEVNQVAQMFNLIRNALICDADSVPDDVYQKRGEPLWMYDVVINHTFHHAEKLRAYRKTLGK
jgi:hypothetical protein